MADVFIVDHEVDFRDRLSRDLIRDGIRVRTFEGMRTAVDAARRGELPRMLLSDVRLNDGNGLGLLRTLRGIDPLLPVILFAHRCDLQTAVQAMREGAIDVRDKSAGSTDLRSAVKRTLVPIGTPARRSSRRGAPTASRARACTAIPRRFAACGP